MDMRSLITSLLLLLSTTLILYSLLRILINKMKLPREVVPTPLSRRRFHRDTRMTLEEFEHRNDPTEWADKPRWIIEPDDEEKKP